MPDSEFYHYSVALSNTLDSHADLIKDLQADIKEIREKFTKLGEIETIQNLSKKIDKLYTVVVEGNGKKSIQDRLNYIDNRMDKLDSLFNEEAQRKHEASSFRRTVTITIVAAFTSAIITLTMSLVQKLF